MTKATIIKKLMEATQDAYMRGWYGERRWNREIKWLLEVCDLKPVEVEAIMFSKYPRWAEDTMKLESLFIREPQLLSPGAIAKLVKGTNLSGMFA